MISTTTNDDDRQKKIKFCFFVFNFTKKKKILNGFFWKKTCFNQIKDDIKVKSDTHRVLLHITWLLTGQRKNYFIALSSSSFEEKFVPFKYFLLNKKNKSHHWSVVYFDFQNTEIIIQVGKKVTFKIFHKW